LHRSPTPLTRRGPCRLISVVVRRAAEARRNQEITIEAASFAAARVQSAKNEKTNSGSAATHWGLESDDGSTDVTAGIVSEHVL